MWNRDAPGENGTSDLNSANGVDRRYCVAASVNDELIAAVEGWRRAHGVVEQHEALGELVRLGLMSEVAKIYRLMCRDGQHSDDPRVDVHRKRRRQHRSRRWERREHSVPAN